MHESVRKTEGGEFGKFLEDNLRLDYRFDKPEALQGFRMMGMGLWRMGHKFCTGLLAEQGMEFINVEPPDGDPARQLTPFGREEYMLKDAATGTRCGLDFLHEIRNARSVTLNIETKEGQEMYKNTGRPDGRHRRGIPPGYMDSLGLGYRHLSKLNPRPGLSAGSVQMGQWGPMKDRLSKHGQWMLSPFAACADAWVSNTGFPPDQCPRGGKGGDPVRSGVALDDYVAGEQAAITILAALYYRDDVRRRRPVHRVHRGRDPAGHPGLRHHLVRLQQVHQGQDRRLGPEPEPVRVEPLQRRLHDDRRPDRPAVVPHRHVHRAGPPHVRAPDP